MSNQKRMAIDPELLEKINGGALGYDPDDHGTYTMKCEFSGDKYYNVALTDIIKIAQYAAVIPNTAEGEKQITNWAKEQGYIH